MVGRHTSFLVTKRSLRNSDSSTGRRPRRVIQSKNVDDTVGLSRREEQELNKALYASLQENRRSKILSGFGDGISSFTSSGHSHNISSSSSGHSQNISNSSSSSHSNNISSSSHSYNISSSSSSASFGKGSFKGNRSLQETSSTTSTVSSSGGSSRVSKSQKLVHTLKHSLLSGRASPKRLSRHRDLTASLSVDESSQDSLRSSASSHNGSKRKVHAQRKFAQGCSLPGMTSCTPVKFTTPSVKMLSSRVPKTEDFLTFLCLRGSSILPSHLDFFNFSLEEPPSCKEGSKPAAYTDKTQRQGTSDCSSTSSGANEEVADTANVTTPTMASRSSGGLLARRSAARASAGTPETARGIVSLRQGLQRKVPTSSSSSSLARCPVSSSCLLPASQLTNNPPCQYRNKFYFTPEKSPSPSKTSGIRPGEFTPPSLFSSTSHMSSTYKFSPLVCSPLKSASIEQPFGSPASQSTSSRSSSLSATSLCGASKRKRRITVPARAATNKVTCNNGSSVPSFRLAKCTRLDGLVCVSSLTPKSVSPALPPIASLTSSINSPTSVPITPSTTSVPITPSSRSPAHNPPQTENQASSSARPSSTFCSPTSTNFKTANRTHHIHKNKATTPEFQPPYHQPTTTFSKFKHPIHKIPSWRNLRYSRTLLSTPKNGKFRSSSYFKYSWKKTSRIRPNSTNSLFKTDPNPNMIHSDHIIHTPSVSACSPNFDRCCNLHECLSSRTNPESLHVWPVPSSKVLCMFGCKHVHDKSTVQTGTCHLQCQNSVLTPELTNNDNDNCSYADYSVINVCSDDSRSSEQQEVSVSADNVSDCEVDRAFLRDVSDVDEGRVFSKDVSDVDVLKTCHRGVSDSDVNGKCHIHDSHFDANRTCHSHESYFDANRTCHSRNSHFDDNRTCNSHDSDFDADRTCDNSSHYAADRACSRDSHVHVGRTCHSRDTHFDTERIHHSSGSPVKASGTHNKSVFDFHVKRTFHGCVSNSDDNRTFHNGVSDFDDSRTIPRSVFDFDESRKIQNSPFNVNRTYNFDVDRTFNKNAHNFSVQKGRSDDNDENINSIDCNEVANTEWHSADEYKVANINDSDQENTDFACNKNDNVHFSATSRWEHKHRAENANNSCILSVRRKSKKKHYRYHSKHRDRQKANECQKREGKGKYRLVKEVPKVKIRIVRRHSVNNCEVSSNLIESECHFQDSIVDKKPSGADFQKEFLKMLQTGGVPHLPDSESAENISCRKNVTWSVNGDGHLKDVGQRMWRAGICRQHADVEWSCEDSESCSEPCSDAVQQINHVNRDVNVKSTGHTKKTNQGKPDKLSVEFSEDSLSEHEKNSSEYVGYKKNHSQCGNVNKSHGEHGECQKNHSECGGYQKNHSDHVDCQKNERECGSYKKKTHNESENYHKNHSDHVVNRRNHSKCVDYQRNHDHQNYRRNHIKPVNRLRSHSNHVSYQKNHIEFVDSQRVQRGLVSKKTADHRKLLDEQDTEDETLSTTSQKECLQLSSDNLQHGRPSVTAGSRNQETENRNTKSIKESANLADSITLRDKVISAFAKFNRKDIIVSSIEAIHGSMASEPPASVFQPDCNTEACDKPADNDLVDKASVTNCQLSEYCVDDVCKCGTTKLPKEANISNPKGGCVGKTDSGIQLLEDESSRQMLDGSIGQDKEMNRLPGEADGTRVGFSDVSSGTNSETTSDRPVLESSFKGEYNHCEVEKSSALDLRTCCSVKQASFHLKVSSEQDNGMDVECNRSTQTEPLDLSEGGKDSGSTDHNLATNQVSGDKNAATSQGLAPKHDDIASSCSESQGNSPKHDDIASSCSESQGNSPKHDDIVSSCSESQGNFSKHDDIVSSCAASQRNSHKHDDIVSSCTASQGNFSKHDDIVSSCSTKNLQSYNRQGRVNPVEHSQTQTTQAEVYKEIGTDTYSCDQQQVVTTEKEAPHPGCKVNNEFNTKSQNTRVSKCRISPLFRHKTAVHLTRGGKKQFKIKMVDVGHHAVKEYEIQQSSVNCKCHKYKIRNETNENAKNAKHSLLKQPIDTGPQSVKPHLQISDCSMAQQKHPGSSCVNICIQTDNACNDASERNLASRSESSELQVELGSDQRTVKVQVSNSNLNFLDASFCQENYANNADSREYNNVITVEMSDSPQSDTTIKDSTHPSCENSHGMTSRRFHATNHSCITSQPRDDSSDSQDTTSASEAFNLSHKDKARTDWDVVDGANTCPSDPKQNGNGDVNRKISNNQSYTPQLQKKNTWLSKSVLFAKQDTCSRRSTHEFLEQLDCYISGVTYLHDGVEKYDPEETSVQDESDDVIMLSDDVKDADVKADITNDNNINLTNSSDSPVANSISDLVIDLSVHSRSDSDSSSSWSNCSNSSSSSSDSCSIGFHDENAASDCNSGNLFAEICDLTESNSNTTITSNGESLFESVVHKESTPTGLLDLRKKTSENLKGDCISDTDLTWLSKNVISQNNTLEKTKSNISSACTNFKQNLCSSVFSSMHKTLENDHSAHSAQPLENNVQEGSKHQNVSSKLKRFQKHDGEYNSLHQRQRGLSQQLESEDTSEDNTLTGHQYSQLNSNKERTPPIGQHSLESQNKGLQSSECCRALFGIQGEQFCSKNSIILHSYGSLNTGEGFTVVNGKLKQCEILSKEHLQSKSTKCFHQSCKSSCQCPAAKEMASVAMKHPTTFNTNITPSSACGPKMQDDIPTKQQNNDVDRIEQLPKKSLSYQIRNSSNKQNGVKCHHRKLSFYPPRNIRSSNSCSANNIPGSLSESAEAAGSLEYVDLSQQLEQVQISSCINHRHTSSRGYTPSLKKHVGRSDASQFILKPKHKRKLTSAARNYQSLSHRKQHQARLPGSHTSNKVFASQKENTLSLQQLPKLVQTVRTKAPGVLSSVAQSSLGDSSGTARSVLSTNRPLAPKPYPSLCQVNTQLSSSSDSVSDRNILRSAYISDLQWLNREVSPKSSNELPYSYTNSHCPSQPITQITSYNPECTFTSKTGVKTLGAPGRHDSSHNNCTLMSKPTLSGADRRHVKDTSLAGLNNNATMSDSYACTNTLGSETYAKPARPTAPSTNRGGALNPGFQHSQHISETLSSGASAIPATAGPPAAAPASSSGLSHIDHSPINLSRSRKTHQGYSGEWTMEIPCSTSPVSYLTNSPEENVLDVIMEELKVQIALLKEEIMRESQQHAADSHASYSRGRKNKSLSKGSLRPKGQREFLLSQRRKSYRFGLQEFDHLFDFSNGNVNIAAGSSRGRDTLGPDLNGLSYDTTLPGAEALTSGHDLPRHRGHPSSSSGILMLDNTPALPRGSHQVTGNCGQVFRGEGTLTSTDTTFGGVNSGVANLSRKTVDTTSDLPLTMPEGEDVKDYIEVSSDGIHGSPPNTINRVMDQMCGPVSSMPCRQAIQKSPLGAFTPVAASLRSPGRPVRSGSPGRVRRSNDQLNDSVGNVKSARKSLFGKSTSIVQQQAKRIVDKSVGSPSSRWKDRIRTKLIKSDDDGINNRKKPLKSERSERERRKRKRAYDFVQEVSERRSINKRPKREAKINRRTSTRLREMSRHAKGSNTYRRTNTVDRMYSVKTTEKDNGNTLAIGGSDENPLAHNVRAEKTEKTTTSSATKPRKPYKIRPLERVRTRAYSMLQASKLALKKARRENAAVKQKAASNNRQIEDSRRRSDFDTRKSPVRTRTAGEKLQITADKVVASTSVDDQVRAGLSQPRVEISPASTCVVTSDKVQVARSSKDSKDGTKLATRRTTPKKAKVQSSPSRVPSSQAAAEENTIPTFHPTEAEFSDPITYISKIQSLAESFGMCRIIPPPSWKLDSNKISEDIRFTSQVQHVHRLYQRWGPNVQHSAAINHHLLSEMSNVNTSPQIGGIEIDLSQLYQLVEEAGGPKKMNDKKHWARIADIMNIPKQAMDRTMRLYDIYCRHVFPYATLSSEERKQLEDEVKAIHDLQTMEDDAVIRGKSMPVSWFNRIARNVQSMWFKEDATPSQIESRYWHIIEDKSKHVVVHCGHINTRSQASAFPTRRESMYTRHPWNLNNVVENQQCVLKYLGPVSGVTIPTLHMNMLFSTSCWSADPHNLPYIQYLHTGAEIIWYCIPKSQHSRFRGAMTELAPTLVAHKQRWLKEDCVMVNPQLLKRKGIRIGRCIQSPRQFVVVFPGAFTATISCGYSVAESVHYATSRWLPLGMEAALILSKSGEKELFSMSALLCSLAQDENVDAPTLAEALPLLSAIVSRELELRAQLQAAGIRGEKRAVFTESPALGNLALKKRLRAVDDEKVCDVCDKICYLSMVLNEQGEQVLCLEHGVRHVHRRKHLKSTRLFLRYNQTELETLVKECRERLARLTSSQDHSPASQESKIRINLK